jgi:hypothetical protein
MLGGMINLYDELAQVVRELDAEQVGYALCGALALAVHGAPRATRDLDLLVRRQDETKVRIAVRRAGYVFEALPMRFASGVEMQRFSKLIDGRPLMLDFLWATDALDAIWSRRQRIPWKEGDIYVVSREDLITLKLTAGRPQDLVDIQSLAGAEAGNDKGA